MRPLSLRLPGIVDRDRRACPQPQPVLLAINAMSLDMDEAGTRASTHKLLDLAERDGVKLIIYGHDAAQWQTLRTAPEFYE